MESCIFCKIVKGEIAAAKVWENDDYLAFLSIAPLNPGHTLVIPKKHIDYIFDLDEKTLGELLVVCKPIAQAIKKAFNPQTGKVGVVVAGVEVHHVHIHLILMDHEGDLSFERARHDITPGEIEINGEKVRQALKEGPFPNW